MSEYFLNLILVNYHQLYPSAKFLSTRRIKTFIKGWNTLSGFHLPQNSFSCKILFKKRESEENSADEEFCLFTGNSYYSYNTFCLFHFNQENQHTTKNQIYLVLSIVDSVLIKNVSSQLKRHIMMHLLGSVSEFHACFQFPAAKATGL